MGTLQLCSHRNFQVHSTELLTIVARAIHLEKFVSSELGLQAGLGSPNTMGFTPYLRGKRIRPQVGSKPKESRTHPVCRLEDSPLHAPSLKQVSWDVRTAAGFHSLSLKVIRSIAGGLHSFLYNPPASHLETPLLLTDHTPPHPSWPGRLPRGDPQVR